MPSINWPKEIQPLIKKYKGKKHPLDHRNTYELLVVVVLSAQDSDRNINKIAPELFKVFPDMKSLSKANPESIFPFINKVRNFGNKTKWLLALSAEIKEDKNIPTTLVGLTALPGIGMIQGMLLALVLFDERLDCLWPTNGSHNFMSYKSRPSLKNLMLYTSSLVLFSR